MPTTTKISLDEMIDQRTPAQKIGEAAAVGRTELASGIKASPKKMELALARATKAKRDAVRAFALDKCDWALSEAINIAKTDKSAKNKLSAINLILLYGMGKPTSYSGEVDLTRPVPILNIISGDGQTRTISMPVIPTNFQVEVEEDDDAEEE